MIEPTTFGGTFGLAKLSVGDIRILNDGDSYVFKPKEDITNIELAHLMRLFINLVAGDKHHTNYDSWGFIERYGLHRHFEKVVML